MMLEGALMLVGFALELDAVVEAELALRRRGGSDGGTEVLRGGRGGGGGAGWLTCRRRNGLFDGIVGMTGDRPAEWLCECGDDE